MRVHGPYGHNRHINDTLATLDRLYAYLEKVRQNKDLTDTMMYVSSVAMDKLYEAKISPGCTADLMAIGNGMKEGQRWAMTCK